MTEPYVVSALRLKRAEISGHIHDLEKRIARQRANLANLDATIKLFSPGTNPDAIPPKRVYRRTRYFAHNELDAAFKEIVANRALTLLRRLVKRGTVIKHGTSRDAQWALAHQFADVSEF